MKNKIIQGDCLDPKKYPEMKFDLILFDPPFPPKKQKYEQIWSDPKNILESIETPTPKDYPLWWDKLCQILMNKLKKSGWFIVKSDDYGSKFIFPITFKYFDYIGDIIWDKKAIGLGYYIRKRHEVLSVYRPKKAKNTYWFRKIRKDALKGSWHGEGKGRSFPSVISILKSQSGIKGQKKQKHINETPVKIWYPFLKWMCPLNGTVLDPCAGIGSIGIACKQMGREYHGIELDQKYVDLGNSRIEKTNNNRLDSLF